MDFIGSPVILRKEWHRTPGTIPGVLRFKRDENGGEAISVCDGFMTNDIYFSVGRSV